ncbi:hypothetical protein GCM10009817_31380 [Terrabacter lapilli]|uniref:HNH endonuclease n=1 Tax=Terrabacter lapilli TaxID=436231 RepID=A0ABN2SJI0_9MICO
MDDAAAMTSHRSFHAAGEADAILEVDQLVTLFRSRATRRTPLRQRTLPMLERAVRRHVAETLLADVVPALLGELLEAAADDLVPVRAEDVLTDLEARAEGELRTVELVERCKALLDAAGLEALARLCSTIESSELARSADLGRPRPKGWIEADELTAMEVSSATGLGQQDVGVRLKLALSRTPGASALRHRLKLGSVSLRRACIVFSEIAALPPECGAGIVDSVLRPKDGAPPSPTLFRQRLTRACLAADREAAERRRAARCRRGAHAQLDSDGLGTLTVVNDADKIVAAMERADAVARAARAAGDPRDLDSLRADVITDTLMFGWPQSPTGMQPGWGAEGRFGDRDARDADAGGGADVGASADAGADAGAGDHGRGQRHGGSPAGGWFTRLGHRPAAQVTLVVPFTTAVGLTDAPCELVGHGWVTAEHARQIMLNDDSTWRRLAVDADTGAALHLETRAYRPTAAMRAQVEAVDGTCRAPGCTVPAARCDLDHDIPWPHGPTEAGNLTSKHRPHHNLHTYGHWSVHREGDRVRWRTKTGRVYDTYPKDWLDPLRTSPAARGLPELTEAGCSRAAQLSEPESLPPF